MSAWADRRLHFIGIGGAGMSGLALVCARLGATVTGSDRADSSYMERLRAAGLDPVVGHDAANLPDGAEVVVSTAIGAGNPELALARERGVEPIHRGALLAQLCAEKRLIAVAGTHGKTTTSSMLVWALRSIGADPAFFIGGEVPGLGEDGAAANAGWGEGDWVVAEADESDGSFLDLKPEVAVITNVELDHHARWGTLAELREAFERFVASAAGLALPTVVDANRRKPAPDVAGEPVATLAGGSTGAGSVYPDVAARAGGGSTAAALESAAALAGSPEAKVLRFGPNQPGPAGLSLAVPGRHNLLNARAALAAVELAGLDVERAAAAIASFPGVKRRLELKGSRNGARIYDDYAHHPTEVRAALAALRELDPPPQRVVAVFQPHLYSRTKALAAEFGAALALADEAIVLDVYPAREEPVGELAGVSGLRVADAAADRMGGRPVWWLPRAEQALAALAGRLGKGDVLVTIGAGDVFKLGEQLVDSAEEGG